MAWRASRPQIIDSTISDPTTTGVGSTREEQAASGRARKAALAARASGRRRFVDPATCERDYAAAEVEFMMAMQEYKKRSGRMFPTWSEVLEVLKGLGYEKTSDLPGGDSRPPGWTGVPRDSSRA